MSFPPIGDLFSSYEPEPFADRMPIQGSAMAELMTEPKPKPIEGLKKDTEKHAKVLDFLMKRIRYSERNMSDFYHRWSVNEQKVQAYIHLPDHEQALQDMTENGNPPEPVSIVVPFSWAAITTIVTFLVSVFTSRRPYFQLGANDAQAMLHAKSMETMLQYNNDHTRIVRRLYQMFMDVCIYGFGAVNTLWCEKRGMRTVRSAVPGGYNTRREDKIVYQGNEVSNIDPYMFFPDPRVPMSELAHKGEFVFWRFPESRLTLKRQMNEYGWDHVDDIPKTKPRNEFSKSSRRSLKAKGQSFPGLNDDLGKGEKFEDDFVQVDQGTVWIVPKELDLGDSEKAELWLFAIGNGGQIIQAEPFEADHGMHPVAVSEPYGLGYAFGSPSPADFVNPLQDLISWLVNSHMLNVKSVLNDCFVYDPSGIDAKDMKDLGPGRRYRLKPAAYGRDVRSIIQQIPIVDVTTQHMNDAEMFMRVGYMLLGLNENMMGVATPQSRRSAREVGITTDAGMGRLMLMAKMISAQGVADMVEQMVLNLQQHIDKEFEIQVLGQTGERESVIISPEQLVGDFYYPIHDGALPLDRNATIDSWRQVIQLVAQDPQLRSEWRLSDMIEHAGKLSGVANIDSMRIKMATPNAINEGLNNGQLSPASGMGSSILGGLAGMGVRG
jgi:hypothetical protein